MDKREPQKWKKPLAFLTAGFCLGLLVMWGVLSFTGGKADGEGAGQAVLTGSAAGAAVGEDVVDGSGMEEAAAGEVAADGSSMEEAAVGKGAADGSGMEVEAVGKGAADETAMEGTDVGDSGRRNQEVSADEDEIPVGTASVTQVGSEAGSVVAIGNVMNSQNTVNSQKKEASQKKGTSSKKAASTKKKTSKTKQASEEKEAEEYASDNWDKSAVYLGGDEVIWKNRIYRAKWWTQGETPGKADVWEDTLQEAAPAAGKAEDESDKSQTKDKTANKTDGQKTGSGGSGTKGSGGFKVVGYYPSWKPSETGKIRYDVLTHVVYAFAIPTAEGGLRPLENAATAKKIIKEAHENDVKVLLAVGGWSYQDVPLESTFLSATETAKKRKKFGNAIVKMCKDYGFDGVDMDWEHPRVDGNSSAQYEKLMLYLAKQLHAEGKLLTSAVLSGATPDGNVYYDAAAHTDKVLAAVDWIHVMAYDGGDGERHSSYDFAVACGDYWHKTRGLSSDKVVLGVPFYGRPSWASYEEILKADSSAWKKDSAQINGMTAHYNGVPTIKKKARYAKKNLGGIMIWEITQDTSNVSKSLMTAIGKVAAE